MSLLDSLYQELILDHYKKPRNRGEIEGASLRQEGLNPSCGDELELFLVLEGGKIEEVTFTGEGCVISQSSASMLTGAIKGKTLSEALEVSRKFKDMIHGGPPDDDLGDLKLFQGISKLHTRVKCATLAWVTLEQALEGGQS